MNLIDHIDKHGAATLADELEVSAAIVRMWRQGTASPGSKSRRKLMAMGFSLDEIYYAPKTAKRPARNGRGAK